MHTAAQTSFAVLYLVQYKGCHLDAGCGRRIAVCVHRAVYERTIVHISDAKQMVPVRTYKKTKASSEKPRKSSYPPSPKNKALRACHALQSARIAPGPRPVCPAGLPVSTTQRLAINCSYQEICWEKYEKNTNVTMRVSMWWVVCIRTAVW